MSSSLPLNWLSADGTIRWANPTAYQSLGYSSEEYLGHNLSEFYAEPNILEGIAEQFSTQVLCRHYKTKVFSKDGSHKDVWVIATVNIEDAAQIFRARCVTVDVEQLTRASELQVDALHREVERLVDLNSRERGLVESIFELSPYGILVSDAQGKLSVKNKAAEEIWAGQAQANNVKEWGKYRGFHPDGRPYEGSDWAMARCLKNGEVVEPKETRILRFDGSEGVVLGGAAPIFGQSGELQGAVSVFADVTKFKQAEEQLRLSAQRYFTTLKSIGDAVIATDAQGIITFLNPVAEHLTQWSLEEARGQHLDDVFCMVTENLTTPMEDPIEKVLWERNIVGFPTQTTLTGKHGKRIAVDNSSAPIYDDHGTLAGIVLVFRDVTQKRREEEHRRFISQASTLLGSSLEYAPTLTSVTKLAVPTISDSCSVDIVERGGKLARLAVFHADPVKMQIVRELEARYPTDPASPYGVHEVIRSGKPILLTEIPESLTVEITVDEEHRKLLADLGLKSVMIVPLRARGKTLGAITFLSAESNRRFGPSDLALAEELATCAALAVDNASLYREAQQASRAKDEFLATVSHELRTPLSAILGWAHLLQSPTLSEEKRDHALKTIERNAKAQAQLIEDLLDVSRIISGQLRLELTSVCLSSIIEAAADVIRPAAKSKGVELFLKLEEFSDQTIADGARLQQVIWNLLSNAVKFTPSGGTVTIRVKRVDAQIQIEVSDTGMGIDSEFLPHVFERFKQANSSSTRSNGGLGLGLAIVRHLVELHGGTVCAESAGPAKGCTFRVRLPLAAKGAASSGVDSLQLSNPPNALPSLAGLRILLVDDELDTRELLTEVLERQGAQVVAVSSAANALSEIRNHPPDVMVSDIGMPGEDGYSLIRKVREMSKNRPIPAAALTAYARREDRTRAMMAGFQAHVVKPVEPEELVVVVATLVGRTG